MVLNFAHRGSLTTAPENTLPAFKKAFEQGAKAIELDVQLTKDNELILWHDDTFKRFNNEVKGSIKDFTLKEIKQVDVGTSFSEEYAGTTLTTLDELLEICPTDLIINVEIKNIPVIYEGIEKRIIDCLKNHNRVNDQLIISSFDHVALKNVGAIDPHINLGMLFFYRILETWNYAKSTGLNVKSIHPNEVYTDKAFVEGCKSLGFKVYPYTVNSKKKYEELIGYGVDGVFSNEPGVFGRY